MTCKLSEILLVCFLNCELQRFLGLVNGSTSATYNVTHIMCSFSRLIAVDSSHAESADVMNLSTPHYIFLARGSTNGRGNAHLIIVMFLWDCYSSILLLLLVIMSQLAPLVICLWLLLNC